jgi:hypothetical protein
MIGTQFWGDDRSRLLEFTQTSRQNKEGRKAGIRADFFSCFPAFLIFLFLLISYKVTIAIGRCPFQFTGIEQGHLAILFNQTTGGLAS